MEEGERMIEKIQTVNREFLNRLFDSPGEKYEPIGQFICPDEINGKKIYVAVDNITGDAWTEEFRSHCMATRWLHGKTATNIYGEKLYGRSQT